MNLFGYEMACFLRIINLFFIYVLIAVLFGAYLYQFLEGERPCFLCFLQRSGMIGIAAALLMNFRFGIKVQHYGLAILSALLGRIFALKQISMHVCAAFPNYGEAIYGLDLFVWAYLIYTLAIFACALFTIFFGYAKVREFPPTWGPFEQIAFWAISLITLANVFDTIRPLM